MSGRARVSLAAIAILMALTVSSPASGQQCANCLCNCYWSTDCSGNQTCDWGASCTLSGKLDGLCKAKGGGGGVFPPDLDIAAAAVETWFDAYIVTGQEGPGLPDKALVTAAQSVPLPATVHREIQETVFNALDVAAGFDFVHPPKDCRRHDARCLGQFRIGLDPEGIELLEAVREGFAQAIRTGDPGALVPPLVAFWARGSNYTPHHTGRCYPHGHLGLPYADPLECQIDSLTGLVESLLARAPRPPR